MRARTFCWEGEHRLTEPCCDQAAVERFILDPANHDILAIIKAVRNGLVYGTKVRFPHALVMVLLFKTGR